MVRNAFRCIGHEQIGVILEVARFQHFLINVVGVFGEKMPAPGIKGLTKLGFRSQGLYFIRIRFEAHIAVIGIFAKSSGIGLIGETNFAAFIRKFFTNRWGKCPLMRQINPVVQSKHGVIEVVLGVGKGKSGEQHLAHIGLVVAVGICQIVHIGGIGYNDALPPTHDPGGQQQAIGKDSRFVGIAIAGGIGQDFDAAFFAQIQRVARHFSNVHAPILVNFHGYRITQQGFGSYQFNLESIRDLECGQGSFQFIGYWRRGGCWFSLASKTA